MRRLGEGGLLISCARATRGREMPSLGLMARLGVPVGGRVRKSLAVGDQTALPHWEEKRASLEGAVMPFDVQVKTDRAALEVGRLMRFTLPW